MKSANFCIIFDVLMVAVFYSVWLKVWKSGLCGCLYFFLLQCQRKFSLCLQGLLWSTELEGLGFGLMFAKHIRKTADDTCMWLLHSQI